MSDQAPLGQNGSSLVWSSRRRFLRFFPFLPLLPALLSRVPSVTSIPVVPERLQILSGFLKRGVPLPPSPSAICAVHRSAIEWVSRREAFFRGYTNVEGRFAPIEISASSHPTISYVGWYENAVGEVLGFLDKTGRVLVPAVNTGQLVP